MSQPPKQRAATYYYEPKGAFAKLEQMAFNFAADFSVNEGVNAVDKANRI